MSRDDRAVHFQPQVFDLLLFLVENAHRIVTRDEIIERVWRGRIVSDDAIASRIRDLRRALGDGDRDHRLVRTVRGRGFRFTGKVSVRAPPMVSDAAEGLDTIDVTAPKVPVRDGQPSIAVLPFQRVGDPGQLVAVEEAIPRELITTLASLRWIRVISYGTSSRFRGQIPDLRELGRALQARYCLTGIVELSGSKIVIDAELADTETSQVIWALRKQAKVEEIHALRAEIAASVIGVAELEIPQHEATTLDYLDAENLDAWSAMHVGFQHLHRFTRQGNRMAQRMLDTAIAKDQRLARAYSGKAFVHFQNAFMHYEEDGPSQAALALEQAEKSLALQPHDPFGNFMMGRCHWLRNDPDGSKPWFQRSIEASPNYTWGYYGASWASVFTDDFASALTHANAAIDLSPFDPFRPGMTGNKMWIFIAEGNYPDAVKWAEIAARTPWSHAGMAFFAAMSHWLNGDKGRANAWTAEAQRRNPDLNRDRLMTLVPAVSSGFRDLISRSAAALIV